MEDVELSIKIHLLKSLNYSFVCCIIQSVKSSSHLSRVLSHTSGGDPQLHHPFNQPCTHSALSSNKDAVSGGLGQSSL